MRWIWVSLGVLFVLLGTIGVFLPIMPTVPFLLLAAFFFARSSEKMHAWLLSHQIFGPPIEGWQRNGAIGRRAKILSSLSMLAGFGITVLLGVPLLFLALQAAVLIAVAVFIWTRPEV